MLSKNLSYFTKDNLDNYLKELAKEFRKRNGTTLPAEIILIGGAAISNLYGGWNDFPEDSKQFISSALNTGHYQELFSSIIEEERRSKDILVEFEENYPQAMTESNVNDILKTLKSK